MELTRDKAWELLTCYNKEAFHLRHALTVEAVMGWFAQQLGYGDEKAFWSMVGLLHDLDFEQWPEEHCVKCQQLMRDEGIDERLIRAVASHGWAPVWIFSRSTRWKRCFLLWMNSPVS